MTKFSETDDLNSKQPPFYNRVLHSFSFGAHAFHACLKFPVLLAPILLCWMLYGATIIYLYYYTNWFQLDTVQSLVSTFVVLFFFCTIFSTSSLILLELIEQIETNRPISLFRAIADAIKRDLPKAFPIILVWAAIWFILTLIESLLKGRNNEDEQIPEISYENIAKTLAGYGKFSLIELIFDLINSGVRMVIFLMLPAIAWENETTINSVKKGFCTLKNQQVQMLTGFAMIEVFAMIIFIPPFIMFYFSETGNSHFHDYVWIAIIAYIALASSIYLYMQQMFAALIYMWNLKWLNAARKAKAKGEPVPSLSDVKPPNLLDNIPDLRT